MHASGQRGEIKHHIGFLFRSQRQRIRQHQPPFGIGMYNLDSGAIQRCYDVILFIRTGADVILCDGKPAININRKIGARRSQQ